MDLHFDSFGRKTGRPHWQTTAHLFDATGGSARPSHPHAAGARRLRHRIAHRLFFRFATLMVVAAVNVYVMWTESKRLPPRHLPIVVQL